MRACQKMAQWGPIAEDDGLAGRKSEKGGLAIYEQSRTSDPRHTYDLGFCHDTTHRERPIAPFAANIGPQSGPIVTFPDTRAQKQRIGMRGNQRQSSQPAPGIQNKTHSSSYKPTLRTPPQRQRGFLNA